MDQFRNLMKARQPRYRNSPTVDIARQVVASVLKIDDAIVAESVRLGRRIAAARRPFRTQDTRRYAPLRIGDAPS